MQDVQGLQDIQVLREDFLSQHFHSYIYIAK